MAKDNKHQNNRVYTESVFLCDYFIADQHNKVSIVGIFDQIYATREQLPIKYNSAFLVSVIHGISQSQHKISGNIINPDGTQIGEIHEINAKFGDNGRTTFVHKISNLPITMMGEVEFQIKVDGNMVGSTKVEVMNPPKE